MGSVCNDHLARTKSSQYHHFGVDWDISRNALENKAVEKRTFRRRLPPLLENDIKVIIRHKIGLIFRNFTNHEVARAFAAACGNYEVCEDVYLLIRLRIGTTIIIASTPREEAANLLVRMTELTLSGKLYEVSGCVTATGALVRAVVHGIQAGTPPEVLMAQLRIHTHDEEPCHLYRPTRQICDICLRLGHRSDVCPTPVLRACRHCGLGNPEGGHNCAPKCALCGEANPNGARKRRDRLKKARRLLIIDQKNGDERNYRRSRSGSAPRETLGEPQPVLIQVPVDVYNEAPAERRN
ncbi:hypothetical protein HPB49_020319 [Dermacentor silvarum]|uniref:Uncharacterized protein n=1 Tax=Dermacentor silvarum TaxID=543639 RepID=A0ACB8E291_DERSI|nr:hypothetical protein HPB49_020319 [Dermacentor silvarum]